MCLMISIFLWFGHLYYASVLFRLRATKVKLRFVTNTSKESGADLKKRLDRIGFGINQDEVILGD